jgi:hypothetical protein
MTIFLCHCSEPKLRAEGEANPKQSRFKQTWGISVDGTEDIRYMKRILIPNRPYKSTD